MVNVTIRDGEYFSEEDYANVKNLYMNTDTSVKIIKKDYGLTESNWRTIRKRIFKETGFKREIKSGGHYTKTKTGKYQIIKMNNGFNNAYGTYDTLEQAEKAVALLKKVDWDKKRLGEIRQKVIKWYQTN